MQQTSKYKLNLIDPSDEFSPDPLNANANTLEPQLAAREAAEQALDAKVSAETSARQSAVSSLDAKFTAALGSGGHTARIEAGSYKGDGKSTRTITTPFTPCLVIVDADEVSGRNGWPAVAFRGSAVFQSSGNLFKCKLTWEGNSISWDSSGSSNTPYDALNYYAYTYHYVVIGY